MAELILQHDDRIESKSNAFETLCRAIVGQQISIKAADSVWKNLEIKLHQLKPQIVSAQRRDVLRRCGLSMNKVECFKQLAHFFLTEKITKRYWQKEIVDIRSRLLSIKGVGNWTFEMFAIFYLQHPDIYPINDLGLHHAIGQLYNAGNKPDLEQVIELGQSWVPWRSVATWFLWRSIDTDPVVY